MMGDVSLKRAAHEQLLALDDARRLGDSSSITDPVLLGHCRELLRGLAPEISDDHVDRLTHELACAVAGLGPLEAILADDEVTELMVNGPGRAYVERSGRLEAIELDLDADGICRVVDRIIRPLGLRLDRSSPIVDARLPDGSRLHAVIPPLAIDGPCLTIRRFGARQIGLEDFGVGPDGAAFLGALVTNGWNLLISGGTGAGKTTFLNALSESIGANERVVTIEETAELRLSQPHVVRLEARLANAEGAGGVSVRDLVRTALRMRPDRIVVGEVRGAEALDMLQALNTGHDGSLTTIHANGPAEALARLETLVLMAGSGLTLDAVRSQIGLSIDAVISVVRGPDGQRLVQSVGEVEPSGTGIRELFRADEGGAQVVALPSRPHRCTRLGPQAIPEGRNMPA